MKVSGACACRPFLLAWSKYYPFNSWDACGKNNSLWFLRKLEAGVKPWEPIRGVLAGGTDEGFAAWVGQLRQADGLRNDDVTLLAVTT